MRIKLFLLLCLSTLGLVGCACTSTCGTNCYTCGYYNTYPSSCGAYSCTDNSGFAQFNNPCPGPYQCVY